MAPDTTINTFLYIFFLELVHCLPETQRTTLVRGFFDNLLENFNVRTDLDWKGNTVDKEVFLKLMETMLENIGTENLLNSVKIAFDLIKQERLLVAISNLDQIESVNNPRRALQIIKILQQRKPNIRVLLTSSGKTESVSHFEGFLHIIYNKERKECLQSLQFENTRFDKISEGYEGSFEWIWAHPEYKSWSASDTSKLLYIQGKPGSGKSTLMKYFNRNLLLKEPVAQQAIVARFFYSYRDGELQRSHYNMLISILHDILRQDEAIFYHQCQLEYRTHQRCGPQFKWSYDSLKRILKSLLDYRTNDRLYLIIDAVDESEEKDRREILGLLFELCSQISYTVVKIFMASRPVAQLEARRDQIHNSLKLEDETRVDIYKYAQSQLYGLNSTDILAQATAYMLEYAQGVFLWVKLISEQLIEAHEQGYSEEEIFELLKQLPTELEDFYCLMLEKMKQNKPSLVYATQMFRFILFAKRPLTVDELLHALGILNCVESDPNFVPSDASLGRYIPLAERVILSSGGNFLEIRKHNGTRIVQIMHQTVREFFLSTHGPVANSVFRISEAHAHADIAIACVRYLSVCVANTSLVEKLPKVGNSWDPVHYQHYCRYLNGRPLAIYALSYLESHIGICTDNANIQYATSQLIEQLTVDSVGASLLERWAGTRLLRDSPRENSTQHATAISFRCEALRHSSIYGFEIATELVLQAGTDPHTRDEDGRTPLSWAAGNGHEATVKVLVDNMKVINIDIQDNNVQMPLSRAAMNGHLNIAMSLFGAFLDGKDIYQVTPLSWAAKNGHLAIVRFLVENGAEISYKEFRDTPLSWAVEHGHLDIVRFLVDKGAEIEHVGFSLPPLSWAAKHGHLAIVRFMVEKGVKIEYNDFRRTPLLCAAEHGHLDIVRFLVEQGARIEANYGFSEMPLLLAVEKGHLDIVKYLIRNGASIEIKDGKGRTPVSIAVENNRLDIVKFLIEMC